MANLVFFGRVEVETSRGTERGDNELFVAGEILEGVLSKEEEDMGQIEKERYDMYESCYCVGWEELDQAGLLKKEEAYDAPWRNRNEIGQKKAKWSRLAIPTAFWQHETRTDSVC